MSTRSTSSWTSPTAEELRLKPVPYQLVKIPFSHLAELPETAVKGSTRSLVRRAGCCLEWCTDNSLGAWTFKAQFCERATGKPPSARRTEPKFSDSFAAELSSRPRDSFKESLLGFLDGVVSETSGSLVPFGSPELLHVVFAPNEETRVRSQNRGRFRPELRVIP